jgi:hypothetical protein
MKMEEEAPLLDEEYQKLPLGKDRWSFSEFGDVPDDLVRQLCVELKLNALLFGRVIAAWKRHPKRFTPQPGDGFNSLLSFISLTLFFLFS